MIRFCILFLGLWLSARPAAASGGVHAPLIGVASWTGSMRPTFLGGERVWIKPRKIDDIKPGQIVVVWWEAKRVAVLHRVVRKLHVHGTVVLVTKGDTNPERDPYVCTEENLMGVAEPIVIAQK